MLAKFLLPFLIFPATVLADQPLERLKYNNPGLVVDLGVGLWAWPLPMDFDGDGDLDLVVNCSDKPSNGVYVFENASGSTAKNPMPVFKAARRISKGETNAQISYPGGVPTVLTPGKHHPDFLKSGLEAPVKIDLPENVHPNKVRANHWRMVDFDGDGNNDIVIGVGDWSEYGWDDAYDRYGKWMNGPLRGYVYFARNTGTNETAVYGKPEKILVNGSPLETYGWPSPNFADMDGDGDLDLICGEFLDGFTYFRNIGTREKPKYEKGRRLRTPENDYLTMHVQMITPVVIDWDLDGHPDIICGDEDGRVAFIRNTGRHVSNAPVFEKPKFFQQGADALKFGALATPVGFDWDGDGDTDIVSGNTAGNIAFFENLSGPRVENPKWAAPVLLEAGGQEIRIVAGANGSIQGPCEAKWGYTTLSINDWDGDGLPDLLVNSILGKVVWHRNIGTRTNPKLAPSEPVDVEWEGEQPHLEYGWLRPEGKGLLTQWRTTPVAVDWNKDGLPDLVMMDHQGYLTFFERTEKDGRRLLLPPRRVFLCEDATPEERKSAHFFSVPGEPMLLRYKGRQSPGGSGRRKLSVVDWDGDGNPDILLNGANAAFVRQTRAADGKWFFKDMGLVSPTNIEGHDVSPTTVDFNGDGIPDFLGGAEDGFFYYLRNPRQ
jgi:hypothetical protein